MGSLNVRLGSYIPLHLGWNKGKPLLFWGNFRAAWPSEMTLLSCSQFASRRTGCKIENPVDFFFFPALFLAPRFIPTEPFPQPRRDSSSSRNRQPVMAQVEQLTSPTNCKLKQLSVWDKMRTGKAAFLCFK